MTKKVLFIIGSLRKKSFNRQLAAKCREILMQKGAEISELEYSDIPFMNQDSEMPVPASINRVRAEVAAADGIWIFTPEYNFAVPGVLKNLLDWLSRPLVPGDFTSGTAIAGKKVTECTRGMPRHPPATKDGPSPESPVRGAKGL